jgi:hypothetical protein
MGTSKNHHLMEPAQRKSIQHRGLSHVHGANVAVLRDVPMFLCVLYDNRPIHRKSIGGDRAGLTQKCEILTL